MKLKELLKHHNINWPEGATHAVQDMDGEVKFALSSNIVLDEGVWFRGDSVIHVAEVFDLPLASDWDTAIVSRPEAHPHAELMLQYAQDAAITTEPWLLWQWFDRHSGGVWKDKESFPSWDTNTLYRRKPTTKLIHGHNIPDISFEPSEGEWYYCPSPASPTLSNMVKRQNEGLPHQHRLKHNLCYPFTEEGREAAILHAKAMLGDQS